MSELLWLVIGFASGYYYSKGAAVSRTRATVAAVIGLAVAVVLLALVKK